MTATTQTCVLITCDACGAQIEDDLILHFDSIDDARGAAGHHGWFVAKDGFALCGSAKGRHEDAARERIASLSRDEVEEVQSIYPWIEETYYADDDAAGRAVLAETTTTRPEGADS